MHDAERVLDEPRLSDRDEVMAPIALPVAPSAAARRRGTSPSSRTTARR